MCVSGHLSLGGREGIRVVAAVKTEGVASHAVCPPRPVLHFLP
jgi:hypothetical protein